MREALGTSFRARRPDRIYERGWGVQCQGAPQIICSWSVTIQADRGIPTTFDFDHFNDESPLIVGLDLSQYSDTDNMGSESCIRIKRHTDSITRILKTYMSGGSDFDIVLLLELCSSPGIRSDKETSALMESFGPSTLVKRFHRLTHATQADTQRLMKDGGSMTE